MITTTLLNECSRSSVLRPLRTSNTSCVKALPPKAYLTSFQRGKVCKPYNSVLGEHFRCSWTVPSVIHPTETDEPPVVQIHVTAPTTTDAAPPDSASLKPSDTASIRSARSGRSSKSFMSGRTPKSPSTAGTSPQQLPNADVSAQMSQLNLGETTDDDKLRVVYITEQISHHPPISAYYGVCPARSVEVLGVDQISARVAGTSLKVAPGSLNQGMFINITGGHGTGERYQVTHPTASINGILRGSFYVTISESTIITCTGGRHGQKFRAIMEYKEEVTIFDLKLLSLSNSFSSHGWVKPTFYSKGSFTLYSRATHNMKNGQKSNMFPLLE